MRKVLFYACYLYIFVRLCELNYIFIPLCSINYKVRFNCLLKTAQMRVII